MIDESDKAVEKSVSYYFQKLQKTSRLEGPVLLDPFYKWRRASAVSIIHECNSRESCIKFL